MDEKHTKLTTVYNKVVEKVGFECIGFQYISSRYTSYKWNDLTKYLCAHLTHSAFYTIGTLTLQGRDTYKYYFTYNYNKGSKLHFWYASALKG
jgi:hypothetical protein